MTVTADCVCGHDARQHHQIDVRMGIQRRYCGWTGCGCPWLTPPKPFEHEPLTLHLSHYEAVNLLHALQLAWDADRRPIQALNSGDWCGQLINKLVPLEPQGKANLDA